jgi:hypothetical protein
MEFEERSRRLFSTLERPGFGGSFHVASTDAPAVLSAFDSAHLALALRHLDPAAAAAELRTLYAACQRDNGLVAAERAADEDARHARAAQVGPIFGEDERALLIAPPVAAWAAARLALEQGAACRDLLERATRELDAIWGARLPPDTPLPVILHPLEAGMARSALFDALVDSADDDEWRDDSATLFRSAAACQLDPERALRAGHPFVVEDPVFCGWLLLALEDAGRAWEKLGDTNACRKLRIRADMIAEGIASRLWWDEQEIWGAWNRSRQTRLGAVTIGGLVPAGSRTLAEEGAAKRALDRHLRPSSSPLWTSRGVFATPPQRADRQEDARSQPDAVSPLGHFWAHLALSRADRLADARVARTQLEELALARGFLERFEIRPDGEIAAAGDASAWATLALEMRVLERGTV